VLPFAEKRPPSRRFTRTRFVCREPPAIEPGAFGAADERYSLGFKETKMQWMLLCSKSNGEPRKQFKQWLVPKKEVRDPLAIVDGDYCLITIRLGSFTVEGVYRITSGGEFRLPQPDADELERVARKNSTESIVFDLALSNAIARDENKFDAEVRRSRNLSQDERRRRLCLAPRVPRRRQVTVSVFDRNPHVVADVLERANGVCEGCNKRAPFLRRKGNSPYLEVHHRKKLAEGGEDTVDNAIAICPNCHRKAHFGPLPATT